MENVAAQLKEFFGTTGLRVLVALVVLFVGLLLIKLVTRVSKNSLHKTPLERTTVSFVITLIHFALYALLIYSVVTIVVPDVSAGLIAVLSSCAIAVGLALKDSLTNFASGIIIIFSKPFREGDYVEISGGAEGTVKAIGLLTTTLYTPDNKKVVVNNSSITGNKILNYSERPIRRIDLELNVAYGSDIDKVKSVLGNLAKNHPSVLDTPEPLIRLYKQESSCLVFRFRVWVNNENYWDTYYDLMENSLAAFAKNKIEVPFNQLTVHFNKDKEATNE